MSADILVIGAGPAGLAVAACLRQRGCAPLLIDQAADVASSWRSHYERLHLHTVKSHSALPGMPFADTLPRYVPRQAVVDYLVAYARRHHTAPQFGHEVVAITPLPQGGVSDVTPLPQGGVSDITPLPQGGVSDVTPLPQGGVTDITPLPPGGVCVVHACVPAGAGAAPGWRTTTRDGSRLDTRAVVLATGANHRPHLPVIEGQAGYGGRVLHSHAYRNAAPFAGQRVLVVGMGNTGAEIALDLAEHGVQAALSVRSPLNIVYRDVLGRPTQLSSMLLSKLPTAWGDAIASKFRDWTVGDLSRWGLHTADVSPLRQLREQGKTPVIDVGTVARIKRGQIAVHPGIERFTAQGLRFSDGREAPFDAVILATGYAPEVQRLFPQTPPAVDHNGMPTALIGSGALAGVCFVGFDNRQPGGVLRTIAAQAVRVAEHLGQR